MRFTEKKSFLEDKLCKPLFRDKYIQRFSELHEKASTCNNVATLQNIKVEADALKVRCLNEISNKENDLAAEETVSYGNENEEVSVPKIKKQRTISIKTINTEATWQIETAEDVKRYMVELEKKLLEQIEENTVIHIEF